MMFFIRVLFVCSFTRKTGTIYFNMRDLVTRNRKRRVTLILVGVLFFSSALCIHFFGSSFADKYLQISTNKQNHLDQYSRPAVLGTQQTSEDQAGQIKGVVSPEEEDSLVFRIKTVFSDTVSLAEALVLGALDVEGSANILGTLGVQGDAALGGDVTVDGNLVVQGGEIEATNVVYSITAQDGLSLTGVQEIVLQNTDLGSAQNIFKNFKIGSTTLTAESNDDTLTWEAGTGVSLSNSGKTITIAADGAALNVSGWSKSGSSVVLGTTSDNVGVGTTSPGYKLHVVGNSYFSGSATFAGGTVISSGINNSSGGITNAGPITGATGLTSSGTITLSSLSTGVLQSNVNGVLSSSALNLAGGASLITGALPVSNGGTGLTSVNSGDILYASGSNVFSALGAGAEGEVLTISSGVPAWGSSGAGAPCATCLVDNPGSTQTIIPTAATATGLSIRQANGGTADVFEVSSFDGTTSYFRVDSSGNVLLGSGVTSAMGNLSIAPAGTDPIIIAPTVQGSNQFSGTITSSDLTADRTWTFPNESGTVCLATGNCAGSSGSLGGSGTANYLTKWTGTYTVGQSVLYDNGTNIGIGSTSPGALLDINGTLRTAGLATFSSDLYVAAHATVSGTLRTDQEVDFNSTLGVNGATTLGSTLDVTGMTTIGGNVGIGSSSPSQALDVLGSIRFGAVSANNVLGTSSAGGAPTGVLYWGDRTLCDSSGNCSGTSASVGGSGTTNYLSKWSAAYGLTDSVVYDNGTNVGIGTTVPASKLSIVTGNEYGWQHSDGTVTLASYVGPSYGKITTVGNHALRFGFNGTVETLSLNTDGHVGIWDVSPEAVFEIAGTGTVDTELFMISSVAGGDGDLFTVKRAGNVGIGTSSPLAALHIGQGTPNAIDGTNGDDLFVRDDLEVDGISTLGTTTFAAGTTTFGNGVLRFNSSGEYLYLQSQADDGIHFALGTNGFGNNSMVITTQANRSADHGHNTLQTHPTVFFHSSTAPGTSTVEWGSTSFIGTGSGGGYFQLATGVGHIALSPLSGNVGVGTTSPQAALHVIGDMLLENDQYLYVKDSGGTARQFFGASATDNVEIGSNDFNRIIFNFGGDVRFSGTGGEKMRLKSDGNLGVGTTSPEATLAVNNTGNVDILNLLDDGVEVVTVLNGGNVGIGTSSPVGLLNIQGAVVGKALTILNETGNQNILSASASGTTQLVVDRSGNIGIGSSAPAAKIDVHAPAGFTDYLFDYKVDDEHVGRLTHDGVFILGNGGDCNAFCLSEDVLHTGWNFYIAPHNGGHLLLVPDGNVGIGTITPLAKAHVYKESPAANEILLQVGTAASATRFTVDEDGDGHFGGDVDMRNAYAGNGTFTGPSFSFVNDPNTGIYRPGVDTLGFVTGAAENMTLNADGNVGIGSTSPGIELDVVGNARFSAVGSGTYSADLNLTADGTLTTSSSDMRLKENLVVLDDEDVLEKILQLQTYTFNWKKGGSSDLGMIAQEVAQILPELTFTNKTDGYMGINYSRLSPLLVSAVQEQQRQLTALSLRLDAEGALISQQGAVLGQTTESTQSSEFAQWGSYLSLQDGLWRFITKVAFMAQAEFAEKVTFLREVVFRDAVRFEGETLGTFVVPAGATKVAVSFQKSFSEAPVLFLSGKNPILGGYAAVSTTKDGFIFELERAQEVDITMQWFAVLTEGGAQGATTILESSAVPIVVDEPAPEPSPVPSPSPTSEVPESTSESEATSSSNFEEVAPPSTQSAQVQ